jgi:tetratricopeptide (TPR) repeat protein
MAAAMPLLAAQNSFALTREQQMWCEGKEDASSDLRITSCTAVIEQTRANKKKSEALTNRGKAYRAKGDNDHAIHDFDEALKIDGKDAEAFYNRGLALRDRGETDRALQDLEQAVK